MAGRPWRCRIGMHSYVREDPREERFSVPTGEVCRLCGKHRGAPGIPPAVVGG